VIAEHPETLGGTRDASTVVVLRDAKVLEVLLMQRHSRSGFMGGAYVFPGGKVDEADCFVPEATREALLQATQCFDSTPGTTPSLARKVGFAVAACRELYEEAGLLLGADPIPRIHSNDPHTSSRTSFFNESLMEVDMVKAIESLNYFAHWVTPSYEKKRFDTRFFVARAPEMQEAKGDEHEVTDLCWLPVSEALARQSQNEIVLPPPTLKILKDLSRFENVDEVIECTRRSKVEALMPKIVPGEEGCELVVILPWDENYKMSAGESIEFSGDLSAGFGDFSVSRIELRDGRWQLAGGDV